MREVLTFKAREKELKVGSLRWGDFLLLNERPKEAYEKILSEYNSEIPMLNKRQMHTLFQHLIGKKELKKERKNQIEFEQFLLIEGALMHYLGQDLQSIRERTLEYVMEMMELLPAIIGQSTYEDAKHKNKPDKKAISSLKKELKK